MGLQDGGRREGGRREEGGREEGISLEIEFDIVY